MTTSAPTSAPVYKEPSGKDHVAPKLPCFSRTCSSPTVGLEWFCPKCNQLILKAASKARDSKPAKPSSKPISTRQPGATVEYDCKGKRVRKFFADAFAAKTFYIAKDKAGKNPRVVKG